MKSKWLKFKCGAISRNVNGGPGKIIEVENTADEIIDWADTLLGNRGESLESLAGIKFLETGEGELQYERPLEGDERLRVAKEYLISEGLAWDFEDI